MFIRLFGLCSLFQECSLKYAFSYTNLWYNRGRYLQVIRHGWASKVHTYILQYNSTPRTSVVNRHSYFLFETFGHNRLSESQNQIFEFGFSEECITLYIHFTAFNFKFKIILATLFSYSMLFKANLSATFQKTPKWSLQQTILSKFVYNRCFHVIFARDIKTK